MRVQLADIAKSYGAQVVLDDVSLTIGPRARIGGPPETMDEAHACGVRSNGNETGQSVMRRRLSAVAHPSRPRKHDVRPCKRSARDRGRSGRHTS